jgi:acyl dehydratase
MSVTTKNAPPASHYYEDLPPGIEFDLGSLTFEPAQILEFIRLTGDDHSIYVDPELARRSGLADIVVPGTLVCAMVNGRLASMDIMSDSLVEVTDLDWRCAAPVVAGTVLAIRVQITDRQLGADASRGVIGRRFTVSTTAGALVQEGLSRAVVLTRSVEGARRMEEAVPSFASPNWLQALVKNVGESKEFADATSSFDGSIALHFGVGSMGIRIYRGRIIDQGRAVANNPTFSVGAPASTWLRFASRPRNEFIAFAMDDEFEVRGSTYEYLRMTRALVLMTNAVRALIK